MGKRTRKKNKKRGVGTGCGNIYFTGNGDLMTSSATAEEIALSAAGVQSVNRAPSTYWQYPNALPLESVISMSPATVGLQYSREASRGQVVLLPATAAALGISNFPLYTPTDPFQQAAAAAFVWPSYIPQTTAPAAPPPPPNFIFPQMSPHSTLQAAAAAAQPYATSLLFGSNYLTAVAAALQQQQATNGTGSTNNTSSINLGLGGTVSGAPTMLGSSSSITSSSTSSRYLSLAAMPDPHKQPQQQTSIQQQKPLATQPLPLSMALQAPPPPPLIVSPNTMKIEEWNATEFMAAAAKTTMTTHHQQNHLVMTPTPVVTASQPTIVPPMPIAPAPSQPQPTTALNFETRDKMTTTTTTTTTTNLLELQGNAQALNLMRIPTPPTSANIENATMAAAAVPQLQTQLLFQTANESPAPALLNLSAGQLARNPIGTSTQVADDAVALNFKISDDSDSSTQQQSSASQFVVGVPRALNTNAQQQQLSAVGAPPQMQDVNIQTDTPVCSEDESSSCPLTMHQQQQEQQQPVVSTDIVVNANVAVEAHDSDAQQPLELKKCNMTMTTDGEVTTNVNLANHMNTECHNDERERRTIGVVGVEEQQFKHNFEASSNNENSLIAVPTAGGDDKKLSSGLILSPTAMPITSTSTNQIFSSGNDANNPVNNEAIVSGSNPQTTAEDLTGLELLSNISTSSLAKNTVAHMAVRVKQEPVEHVESTAETVNTSIPQQPLVMNGVECGGSGMPEILMPPVAVEPLGGLNLLCALAEQRIHEEEEVQSAGVVDASATVCSNGLFAQRLVSATPESDQRTSQKLKVQPQQPHFTFAQQLAGAALSTTNATPTTSGALLLQQSSSSFRLDSSSSFPSMEGIELPSTSAGSSSCVVGEHVKRKKHKHSKSSSKSCSSSSLLLSGNATSASGSKKSQRCGKKNKKKYSKEKRKHKLLAEEEFDDHMLQEDFKSAFSDYCRDAKFEHSGSWPSKEAILKIMETNMRLRLADITRQYRKKKRKLEEISKNKKKKKCSKLQAQQAAAAAAAALALTTSSLTAVRNNHTTSSGVVGVTATGLTSSPLSGDYKFSSKFSTATNCATGVNTPFTYLNPATTGLRFAAVAAAADKQAKAHNTHMQFPPPDVDIHDDDRRAGEQRTITSTSYKTVRLEPSALATAIDNRCNGGALHRHAQKRAVTDRSSHVNACKQRKLMKTSTTATRPLRCTSGDDENTKGDGVDDSSPQKQSYHESPSSTLQQQSVQQQQQQRKSNPFDQQLMLTSEHLYRKETRVLTDMGGLFYAGVMKALQPPDVYAITLDGERGNKSHIMSREEIFKDTILEVAPKSVESVPVGTRLCAYWSQQYRCLYPGRAIESESSDNLTTTNDCVSVEFDDGDSGKIRLQNIRLLLSDYPIVEYNDNPLYSLGKQKKVTVKSGNPSDPHYQHYHHHHQHEQPSLSTISTVGCDIKHLGTLTAASELKQNAREMFAKRSERKRMKSLKKKSQVHANGAIKIAAVVGSSAATNTVGAAADGSGVSIGNECSRKHHKHKKRKKHKKHHHRKDINEAEADAVVESGSAAVETAGNNTYSIKKAPNAAVFVGTHEASRMDEYIEDEEIDEDEDGEGEEQFDVNDVSATVEQQKRTELMVNATNKLAAHSTAITTGGIKMEAGNAVKVKTEHLEDMEEETASNMMSEISDEVKGDEEVEHNNSKGSKIAAFLPDRQLWGWLGSSYRKAGVKGRARKQFFKTIKRGKETITVGDCAVFLSTGRPDRPYIGRIESMWETTSSNKVVRVRWFYHPEETKGCPNLRYPGALFESPHEDENDVQTISHRCAVLQFERYFSIFGADSKQYQSIYDNNDTYYLAGFYNPRLQVLKLEDDIPTLEEQNTTTDT